MDTANNINVSISDADRIRKINFDAFKINHNGILQELRKPWEKYNAAWVAAEDQLPMMPERTAKQTLAEMRAMLLTGVITSKEKDSRWYYDSITLLYHVLNNMNELCNALKIEKNNAFEAELYEARSLVGKNINLSRLITSPDAKREKLRQENYWRYVTREFSDALYDNGVSICNMVRHPFNTAGNTIYGIRCFFYDVGPVESIKLIAKQVYKRPWYFASSFAQTYAFNFAVNKLTTKLVEMSGLKEKIKTLTKNATAADANAEALKQQADKANDAISVAAKEIAAVESKIKSLTDKLNSIPDAHKYCPIDEFESLSLYCYIQEFEITSNLEHLKKIIGQYDELKTILQENLKLATDGANTAIIVRDYLKNQAINCANKAQIIENTTNAVSKVAEVTTLTQSLLNGSTCFFQTISHPEVRTSLFELDKMVKTARDLFEKIRIENYADPSPANPIFPV